MKAYGYRNVTNNGLGKIVSEDKGVAERMLEMVRAANQDIEFCLVTFVRDKTERRVWHRGTGRAGNHYCTVVERTTWRELR